MIVTMLRQLTGTRDGVEWPAPGESIDVPDNEAASLIGLGLAEAATDAPADEAPAGRKGARQATNEPA
jgi:hypothetical protein